MSARIGLLALCALLGCTEGPDPTVDQPLWKKDVDHVDCAGQDHSPTHVALGSDKYFIRVENTCAGCEIILTDNNSEDSQPIDRMNVPPRTIRTLSQEPYGNQAIAWGYKCVPVRDTPPSACTGTVEIVLTR